MKFKMLVAVFSFGIFFLTSCTDTVKETIVLKEKETETPSDEGILERTAKKVDAEVNKEIDNEIEKIGNDN